MRTDGASSIAGGVRRPGLSSVIALAALAGLALTGSAAAQNPAQEDDSRAPAPDVELGDFAWLTGTWRGPGPNGATAEIHFMRPRAGGLPSLFRLWQGDRIVVLEAISLVEEKDGLFMYVRHFSPELVPMEEEGALRLRLVERRGDAFRFENTVGGRNPRTSVLTRTESGFTSSSELVEPDGSTSEIRVEYERVEGG